MLKKGVYITVKWVGHVILISILKFLKHKHS